MGNFIICSRPLPGLASRFRFSRLHRGSPHDGRSLTLMTLKEGGTIAQVESFDSGEAVESTRDVVELTERFDVARSMALTDDESGALISRYLREYEDEDAS
ncbi:Scr1 family TA system antitoxin-like transcriptional regulator [Streptomyces sp. M10(2022)]